MDELDKPATKRDLQSFATKADLQSFATKADLQSFATKADLKSAVGELRSEFSEFRVEMRQLVRGIGAQLTRTDERLSKLSDYAYTKLTTRDEFHGRMDAFAGQVTDMRESSPRPQPQ